MEIVSSTFIALPLVLAILLRGPGAGVLILFGLLPMGMMAALNLPAIGGTSILASDLAVLAILVMLVVRPGGMDRLLKVFAPGSPGPYLLFFFGYCVIATLFLPRIFAGAIEVYSLSRSEAGIVLSPLRPGTGNLSQLLRIALVLGVFTATILLMLTRSGPGLALKAVIVASVVHITMGFVDIATNGAGMAWLLDWARTANYALTIGQQISGFNRMIGGFPEASSFGYFSLGLLGFWASFWISNRDKVLYPAVFFVLTAFVVLRSTSSSAYVAAALLALIFVFRMLIESRGASISRRGAAISGTLGALIPLIAVSLLMFYEFSPAFNAFIDRALLDKLDSQSGEERMRWNMQALQNFLDTYLLGAGLGSVRASNWVVAVLGTTGLPGMALLAVFLWRFFQMSLTGTTPEQRILISALKMGCAGFLCRALVVKASPSLDYGFFAMAGMAIGLVATARAAQKGQGVFHSARARRSALRRAPN